LLSGDAIKAKKGSVKKAIAYVGPLEGDLFDMHQNAAKVGDLADSWEFMHTDDVSVLEHFGMSGAGIVVLRNFDEPVVHFSGNSIGDLKNFTASHSNARLINFDEDSIESIFGKKQNALMLFSNDKDADYHRVFAEAAEKLQGKILFVKSTTTDGIQQKLADYVGVDAKTAPTIRLVEFANDDIQKYKFEGSLADLSVDAVNQFIDEFKEGKLKAFMKSEPIPEDNNGPVKTLVGHNWNDIVADPTKDVLVKYYAPWCGHCKSLAPIWTELGQFVEGLDDVVIAKMDST
jgi:protein disulfide-isomerase A1